MAADPDVTQLVSESSVTFSVIERTYQVLVAGSSFAMFTIAADTGLPLSATTTVGTSVTWAYEDAAQSTPPPPPSDLGLEREVYKPIESSDVVAVFGADLPDSLAGGFQLSKLVEYDASTADGPAYYAIWQNDGGAVQMVVNVGGKLEGEQTGFSSGPGPFTLRVQEAGQLVQIFAPDLPAMRALVKAVRPEDVALLPPT